MTKFQDMLNEMVEGLPEEGIQRFEELIEEKSSFEINENLATEIRFGHACGFKYEGEFLEERNRKYHNCRYYQSKSHLIFRYSDCTGEVVEIRVEI